MHARKTIGSLKIAKDWYYASPVGNCTSRFRASCVLPHIFNQIIIFQVCIREMIQHIYGGLLLVAVIEVPFHL